MHLVLQRISSGSDSTIGYIRYYQGLTSHLACFTCEDGRQPYKIAGETRIPAGTYDIEIRTDGGMHSRYNEKFSWHRGMLWLRNVDGFEWVYIHIGNDHEETRGCILVGDYPLPDYAMGGGRVMQSVSAYHRLYKKILAALDSGEKVQITIKDEEV